MLTTVERPFVRQPKPRGPGVREAFAIADSLKSGSVVELERLRATYGDIAYVPFPVRAFVVFSPELIRRVLVVEQRKYRKSNNYGELRYAMGDGLVTSDGPQWVAQRRELSGAFCPHAVAAYRAGWRATTEQLASDWVTQHGGGAPFNAVADLGELTACLANLVLFGREHRASAKRMHALIRAASEAVVARIYNPTAAPRWLPTSANRSERRVVAELDAIVERQSGAPRQGRTPTVLEMLDRSSARRRRDQLVTLLLAGQDTLHAALTWALYCLAAHPEHQERAHSDAAYRTAALSESMRLYPPIPMVGRTPTANTALGEFDIPEGSVVLCALSCLHRHPRLWERPNTFDPTRFVGDQAVPEGAFLPFASGPRKCIGAHLAMAEAEVVLSTLLARFRFSVAPGFRPEPHTTITMFPKNGLWLKLEER